MSANHFRLTHPLILTTEQEFYLRTMPPILSEKGQITIPKALRNNLGLTTGMEIEFTEENGRLVGRKLLRNDPFSQWKGWGACRTRRAWIPTSGASGIRNDDYLGFQLDLRFYTRTHADTAHCPLTCLRQPLN